MDSVGPENGIREYLAILSRRKLAVILCTLFALLVAAAYSLTMTPIYESTSRILVQQRASDSLFNEIAPGLSDTARSIDTERQVIESQPVQQRADEIAEDVSLESVVVSTRTVGLTNVIEIATRSTDPLIAASAANAIAEAYVAFKREQVVNDLTGASSELRSKLDKIQDRVEELTEDIEDSPGDPTAAQDETLRSLTAQQQTFQGLLDQIQVSAALRTGGAQIIEQATVPKSPVEPNLLRNLALALVLGLGLGVGLALLREQYDDSVKSRADLETIAPGVPVLALIPENKEISGTPPLLMSHPRSVAAESFRTMRTSLQFLGLDRPLTRIAVTSPLPEEGKSTIAANIALAAVAAGQRVILIDSDLRNPSQHRMFGLASSPGLMNVLLGQATVEQSIQHVAGASGLGVVTAGAVPPNPAEVLSSQAFTALLDRYAALVDLLIIDTAPVLPVTDPLIVSGLVDGTVLVVRRKSSNRREVRRALELLDQVSAHLPGIILNRDKAGAEYTYTYGQTPTASTHRRKLPTASTAPDVAPPRR
jgi:capsular exopolysaccharide synthesis family protein